MGGLAGGHQLAIKVEEDREFRLLAECIPNLAWIARPDGYIYWYNQRWYEYTGTTATDMQGWGWQSVHDPVTLPDVLRQWRGSIETGEPFEMTFPLRRADGSFQPFLTRVMPLKDAQGKVLRWFGTNTDVGKDLQAAIVLKQQQELLEVAQFTNNVGFWRYRPLNGDLYLSSGSRDLLNLPIEGEVTLSGVLSSVHADDVGKVQHGMEEALRTGNYHVQFRTAASAAGEPCWLLDTARTLSTPEGEPYLVGMKLDITQQKRSAEALIRTEKLAIAGRLAASISHEISNPLEAIGNFLYLLLQSPLSEEQQAYCATMRDELQRVSEIAKNTLRFHRQTVRANTTRIDRLIESVLTLFDGRLRNIDIEVLCDLSDKHEVFGFDSELRQVLANLVGNAIDAMTGSGGRRILHLRTKEGISRKSGRPGVIITVADTGTGIPTSMLARIFEPFYTTKGDVGTGLGLWVSSEIVEKHQGELRFRSSQAREHHGTVFRLFLPLDAPA